MESVYRVRKTDLARNTRQVISAVLRGQTALVESHGTEEAAIIDILDYRLLRATMRYYARQPEIEVAAGLTQDAVAEVADPQECYDLVLAHYLSGSISLARAAELLRLPVLDLRTRFLRLEVPLRVAPRDAGEALEDVQAIGKWRSRAES